MIVTREYTEAKVSDKVESYDGGIAFNAETFRIIISGIYKDKRLAAVREPLFNALDSHIEAGKHSTPILIHSPTNLEPWYSVQDFGLGMDKDMITKTFMVLGESTKRNSNKVVGSKGIGSKAPWAYTDMFTITSVYNGVQTVYSAYLSRGLPKVSVLGSQPSADCNGIEIKFPVNPNDVDAFRRAIKDCLTYVKKPYEINDPYVKEIIDTHAPSCWHRREHEGWTVEFYRERKGHTNVVIMGEQPYVSKTLKDYPPCSVTIPIGDCDVSPGREYTEEGDDDGGFGERLAGFMKKVSDEIGKEITDALEKTTNILEARECFKNKETSFFVKRYGYEWVFKKITNLVGSIELSRSSYSKTGTRAGWVLSDSKPLSPLHLLSTPVVLYADKKSALKRKAVHLGTTHDIDRVHIVHIGDKGEELAKNEYFKPMFIYATSFNAPKLPTVKVARSGNIRVCVIRREEEAYDQWVNKAALADVEYYMIKRAKNQDDATWMGSFREAKHYAKLQFDQLGVDGDEIWLVTESIERHLPKGAVKVTKETWLENTKASYRKWHIRRNLHKVEKVKKALLEFFEVKTLGLSPTNEEFPYGFGYFRSGGHFHETYGAEEQAEKILSRYSRRLDALKESARQKYPLVSKVGFDHWSSPEFLHYRKLIDKEGEECGKTSI